MLEMVIKKKQDVIESGSNWIFQPEAKSLICNFPQISPGNFYGDISVVSVHPETVTVQKISQKSDYAVGNFDAICYGPYTRV